MSDNLGRLIAAFRRMDEAAQRDCVCMLEGVAEGFPAKRPARLHLVSDAGALRENVVRTMPQHGGTA